MTVSIYACGGTGANIAKQVKDLDIEINYVDSSDANLRGVSEDNIYLIQDQEGAGKKRGITYDNFKDVAGDVLIKFKPSKDINIVMSSLSGGSGSVIAPLLVKELLDKDATVIVIAIDSNSSLIELTNTVNTLKTYKGISKQMKKSVSMFHVENKSRKEADRKSIDFISLLSLLVDRSRTSEFDVTDLRNFVEFDTVTDNTPDVGMLNISANEPIQIEKNTVIVSTILLTKDIESDIKPILPEYLATCVVTDEGYTLEDLRIDNTLGSLSILIDSIEEDISEMRDNKRINKFKEVETDSNTDDGMFVL